MTPPDREERLWRSRQLESVGVLSRGAAHDLNNHLTAIFGYLDLARLRLEKGHEALRALEGLQRAAEEASRMVRSVLEGGRLKLAVHLGRLLESVVQPLRRVVPEALEIAVDPGPAKETEVEGNLDTLQRMIVMIALRVRDAAPSEGALRIEATIPDGPSGGVVLVLEHPPAEETRVETLAPIVEEHGARLLEIDRQRVKLVLPLLGSAAAEAVEVTGLGETILLAESNRQVRAIMASTLDAAGYRIVQAVDFEQTLREFRARGGEIHLLVMDLDLPGRDGMACLREMREVRPGLPAVVISGYGVPEGVRIGERETAFLRKPFRMAELTALVRRTLAGREEETNAAGHQDPSR